MKIDKEILISFVKGLPAKIKSYFRTLYDLPHSGKYLILSVLFFVLFFIFTFPYDAIVRKKIYSLEGNLFRSIEISNFEFNLFSETYIKNLLIATNGNNEISCKNSIINISLNPYTLLLKNRLKADFQFDSLKYIGKEFILNFNINGNINFLMDTAKNYPKDGPLKIIMSDSIVKLNNFTIPGPMGPFKLQIESINIQSGNIDGIVTNGILRFNTFKISGPDISCNASGNIDFNNSKIDLVVMIDSESSALEPYRDLLSSIIKNNQLSLRLRGSLSKPEFLLNNPDKNEN